MLKVEKDRTSIPSERGTRYFGPSKMSFKNLLIHSLSIISVFKINVLIKIYIIFVSLFIFNSTKRNNINANSNILVFGLIVLVFVYLKEKI